MNPGIVRCTAVKINPWFLPLLINYKQRKSLKFPEKEASCTNEMPGRVLYTPVVGTVLCLTVGVGEMLLLGALLLSGREKLQNIKEDGF